MLIFKEKSTYSSEEQNNFKSFLRRRYLTAPKNDLRTVEAVSSTPLLLGVRLAISCFLPEFLFQGCLKGLKKNLRLLLQKCIFKFLLVNQLNMVGIWVCYLTPFPSDEAHLCTKFFPVLSCKDLNTPLCFLSAAHKTAPP